jgi:putative zinc finger/helix-turn-helix YgiT family protein
MTNSPITGKEMTLVTEQRVLTYRKEKFTVTFHFYKCADSGEQFTTNELDDINTGQVYSQYRKAHNIPDPEQIKQLRKRYKVSASKMSKILGFGANMFRKYENGEIPNESNSRLIQLVKKPENFKELVELSGVSL